MRNYQRVTHWTAMIACAGAMTLYIGVLLYLPAPTIIGIPVFVAGIAVALWGAGHKDQGVNDDPQLLQPSVEP